MSSPGGYRAYEPQRIEIADRQEMIEQLNRELFAIANAFIIVDDKVTGEAPPKLQEGMLRYFDGQTYDPGLGAGLYIYTGGTWNKLDMTPVP